MIIALHGKAGAGKDAFADRLVAEHGFMKRGFAAPLYEEVAEAFGVAVPWLQDRSRKELPQRELAIGQCADYDFRKLICPEGQYDVWHAPRSPRWVLQYWGTEYRRAQDDDYWIGRFGAYCKAAYEVGARGVVANDTRYPNEAQFVNRSGGKVLEIYRPGLSPVEGEHISAKRLPQSLLAATFWNVGSLDTLHRLVDAYVVSISEVACPEA